MEVAAVERGQTAYWSSLFTNLRGLGTIAVGVWSEKRSGLGEDAEPLVLHNSVEDIGLLAVFDGVGGAGAARAGTSWRGNDRTGAWVGSRVARAATEEWFAEVAARDLPTHAAVGTAESLQAHLGARMTEVRPARRRKIIGSMRSELPTTMAALSYRATVEILHWTALWAGDSRCYLLDSESGLQQLSHDDVEGDDAMALLTEDPPMSNYICADRPFTINSASNDTSPPAVLICATDGFFGYLDTPAAFEHVLLSTLLAAHGPDDWGVRIGECVAGYTGDDAALSLVAFGWDEFSALQNQFADRQAIIESGYWEPVQRAAHDRAAYVAARDDAWARYRGSYEQHLPRSAQ